MIKDLNWVYCDDWMNNGLPDKSIQLIFGDGPYFEVKGEFDFIWKSFDEYLKNVSIWAMECKRLLADNGTLLWYGSSKNIAYSQIIFDKHFNLINNLVWNKGSFMGLEGSEGLRSFAPCTERILMYGSQAQDLTGLKTIEKEYVAPRNPFALQLKKARLKKGISINEVAEFGKFYGKVNHGGTVTNWERGYNIPLQNQWAVLCEHLPIERKDYKVLRMEYDQLRSEYEHLKRPFNNEFHLQEILNFSNEEVSTGFKYDHDTVKPETLTRALIITCSRKGDTILIPFAGSGTECAMSMKEGRNFIAFDLLQKNVDMSNKRCKVIKSNPELY